jgi:hypothetical protein
MYVGKLHFPFIGEKISIYEIKKNRRSCSSSPKPSNSNVMASLAEDNLERTLEEVEALRSILGEEYVICEMPDTSPNDAVVVLRVKVCPSSSRNPSRNPSRNHEHHIMLTAVLSNMYPSHAPPQFDVMFEGVPPIQEVLATFENLYTSAEGEVFLYDCVQWLSEKLEEGIQRQEDETAQHQQYADEIRQRAAERLSAKKELLASCGRRFVHGETLIDRKSVFQAHLARPTHPEEISLLLRALKNDKKIAAASHNIWAYRVGGQYADNDDDGETAAGKRLALLLDHTGATNVLVVVSRWYGGIHLGPDRFRHINNVARMLMVRERCTAATSVTSKTIISTKKNGRRKKSTR